jgi:small GTP-binding protein
MVDISQENLKAHRHKIVLLGPSSAGKTSIIHRYAKGNFYEGVEQPTIGTAFYSRDVHIDSTRISLNIWDTAGMERYKSLVPKYSKGASAVIIVFDITDPQSYTQAKELLIEAPNTCDARSVTVFVGNKLDRGSAVDVQEAREFANAHRATFMETSARTGENVVELFLFVARQLTLEGSSNAGVDIAAKAPSPENPLDNCC